MKISPLSSSSLSFPLKLSMYPFSHGLPGSMNKVPTSNLESQSERFGYKLRPLSDLMCFGTPYLSISFANVRRTSRDVLLASDLDGQALTRVFIHDCQELHGLPSRVRSNT